MSFLDKIQKSWSDGAKAVIPGDNGNDISLESGINFVMSEAKRFEESSKTKVTENTINPKTAEERS